MPFAANILYINIFYFFRYEYISKRHGGRATIICLNGRKSLDQVTFFAASDGCKTHLVLLSVSELR